MRSRESGFPRFMAKFLIWTVVLAAVVYIGITGFLYAIQRQLVYPVDPVYHTPAEAGFGDVVREVRLETPDGVTLIAWQAKPAAGQPTLLYFHGNGGSLFDRAERIRRFTREGLGVFMLAYRGYGGSGGSPSETAIAADAQLAYDHLAAEGAKPQDIVAYGESLGTGVAVRLATSRQVGAVVLDAPYTSIAAIGQRRYPFIPVGLFLLDKFDSLGRIRDIHAPLLILHGSADRTIPVELGRALFDAAAEPKEMHVLQGAGHSDIYNFGAMRFLLGFLKTHLRQPAKVVR